MYRTTRQRFWFKFFSYLIIVHYVAQPGVASAQWWNPLAPKTYEECLLKNMRGVSVKEAADLIQYSCAKQFSYGGLFSDNDLRAAFVNSQCNFTWAGGSFVPLAQHKNDRFIKFRITNKELTVGFILWIPTSLVKTWNEDTKASVQVLIAKHEKNGGSLVKPCKRMSELASGAP